MVHGLLFTLREKENMFELNGPNFSNQKEFRISEVAFFQSTFKNLFLKFNVLIKKSKFLYISIIEKCQSESVYQQFHFSVGNCPQ